jgi:hypothetical protein
MPGSGHQAPGDESIVSRDAYSILATPEDRLIHRSKGALHRAGLRLGLMAIVCLAPGAVLAQYEHDVEIAPFVGFRAGGHFSEISSGQDFEFENDISYGVIIDFNIDGSSQIELMGSGQRTDLVAQGGGSPLDVDVYQFQIGGLYQWDKREKIFPFILASVGITHIDPYDTPADPETFFAFSVGTGVKYFLNKWLGVRFDLRAYFTLVNGTSSIFCGSSGSCLLVVNGTVMTQAEASAAAVFRF